MTIEHDLLGDVARLRVMGEFRVRRDINLLTVMIGNYASEPRCSSIEIDLALVFSINQPAVAALAAARDVAGAHGKAFRIVSSHGKVRVALQEARVLPAGSGGSRPERGIGKGVPDGRGALGRFAALRDTYEELRKRTLRAAQRAAALERATTQAVEAARLIRAQRRQLGTRR